MRLLLFLVTLLAAPYVTFAQEDSTPPPALDVTVNYYKATVTKITEPDLDDPNAQADTITVDLTINGSGRNGKTVQALWSNNSQTARTFPVDQGTRVLIMCTTIDSTETCDIISLQRQTPLYILGVIFLGVIWWLTRTRGLRAIGSMLLSLLIITFVIIPLIIKGFPPFLLTIIAGLVMIIPTIYLSHGWNTKSHIALISIMLAVLVIGVLSLIFINALSLSGMASDEALYLSTTIDLRAILLSAILLGALGVIDDLAVTQVSIVNELYHANPRMSQTDLARRAIAVGQDHITSVINTLFLAYAGVALPLLILIQQNEVPYFVALQQEPLATEIMRTLIGTIGLMLVVPLTTWTAAYLIKKLPERFPAEAHHHAH